jgi:DNA-binding transcriptional ArsR family regulator
MLDASDPPDERHAALPLSAESVLATSWLGRLNPCLCLDDVVHQRTRLALLCELNAAGELDFNSMKDLLCLSDGNLARHLTVLRAAGLIDLEKRVEGRRRRTYATLTGKGSDALAEEFALLEKLIVVVRQLDVRSEHLAS